MQDVSIIVIGHEILEGITLDTNSHWLCEFLTGLGGKVRRVVQVPDEPEAIVAEINSCRQMEERLIFTIGGLGPTADDVTLQAVSQALSLPLEQNLEALNMVSSAYHKLHQSRIVDSEELTESRLKMCILPRGAHALRNPIGVAPAVLLEVPVGESTEPALPWEPNEPWRLSSANLLLICLPGVPREMKAVIESSLASELSKRFGKSAYMREDFLSECRDESSLAVPLNELSLEFPRVFIKSHKERFGNDVKIRLSVSCAAGDWDETRELMAKATARLSAKLAKQRILLHSLVKHQDAPV
jgi:nicotinamide-nucleotide amidase